MLCWVWPLWTLDIPRADPTPGPVQAHVEVPHKGWFLMGTQRDGRPLAGTVQVIKARCLRGYDF